MLVFAQLLFEQARSAEACAYLLPAQTAVPEAAAELRNQLQFQARRCVGVDTSAHQREVEAAAAFTAATLSGLAPPPPPPVTASTNPAGPGSTSGGRQTGAPATTQGRPETTAPSSHPLYTVQIGAFNTRTEAASVVARMGKAGFDARVVGGTKPFRVRIGRFQTRAEADSLSKQLTARKITNLVTTIGPEER